VPTHGELAGLHRRRVRLNQPIPPCKSSTFATKQAANSAAASNHGSQSDASVREIPLAPQVVEVMRRRLPPGSNPAALLFTGLGGGPGQRSGPGVKKGTRTVLSRHNFHRTYHGALANSPTQPPRDSGRPPPASWALRGHGPLTGEQLAAQLSAQGRTAVKATIDCALAEFAAAEVAADARTGRWMLRQPPSIPCLRRSTCTAPTKPGTPS
jgi:hypothetical protein